MRKTLGLMLLFVLVSGCSNAVWVREKDPGSEEAYRQIGGIPFYIKTEVLVQETSYLKTWLKATLTVEGNLTSTTDPKAETIVPTRQSIEKYLAKADVTRLNDIKAKILQVHVVPNGNIKGIISDFMNLKDVVLSEIPTECVGNEVKSTWVVNGRTTYYLNAPLPWFGSATLTQELNADGTLSKAGTTADTKLAEAVSSLLPIKESLTGKFIGVPGIGVEPTSQLDQDKTVKQPSPPYTISLSLSEEGYRYRFTKQYTHKEMPTTFPPIPFDTKNGLFTREAITQKIDGQIQPEDGKKVGLSGTISFPADWGGSK